MPVQLSVSEVRRAIYRASDFAAGNGQPSTDLLGSLFHRVFRDIMDPASPCGWTNVLDRDNLEDHQRLRTQAYACLIGPSLIQHRLELQPSASEVLSLWEATGHLCECICQLLRNNVEQKVLRYDARHNEWIGAEHFATEQKLTWEIQEPTWSAPVLISGIADAVWHNPGSKNWGIVELKLGAGSPEADLAQACLYHDMLHASLGSAPGRLSVWHFRPQLMRTKLTGEEIAPVRDKLRALIGRLAGVAPEARQDEYKALGTRLIDVLKQFGPMVTLESDPVIGPTFLRFHIRPGPGVKINKILPLGQDLAVQLRLSEPALISLEDGVLVVDVQRPDRELLHFSEFERQLPGSESGNAKMLAGISLKREPRYADLSSDCPHLLAAGTTGSGKSEWLRTALASLFATNTPRTLRVMLIDPKRVTFGELRSSAFLLDAEPGLTGALLYTPEEAIGGLQRLIELMEERYQLFARHGVDNLAALRAKHSEPLPRIVCFCDEYGNLVAQKKARQAIEMSINQLGSKARAAGIHLVVATQDPRAQILSPVLKANLPARVCLRTASALQSRMMLEQNGAESLLGYGDLFFKTVGAPIRLQAPLLSEADRAQLFGVQKASDA